MDDVSNLLYHLIRSMQIWSNYCTRTWIHLDRLFVCVNDPLTAMLNTRSSFYLSPLTRSITISLPSKLLFLMLLASFHGDRLFYVTHKKSRCKIQFQSSHVELLWFGKNIFDLVSLLAAVCCSVKVGCLLPPGGTTLHKGKSTSRIH